MLGYTNNNDFPVYIAIGPNNQLLESTTNTVRFPPQIDTFLPGTHTNLFHVRASTNWVIVWTIVSPNGHSNSITITSTSAPACPGSRPNPIGSSPLCPDKTCGAGELCCNNTAIGGFGQCYNPATHRCCTNEAGLSILCGSDTNACCGDACFPTSNYQCAAGQLVAIVQPRPVTCDQFNGPNGVDSAGCYATPGCSFCNPSASLSSGMCYNTTTQCCASVSGCTGQCVVCEAGGCCGGFWAEDSAKCCTRTQRCCAGIRHSFCCGEDEECCPDSVIPCCVPKGTACAYTADRIQCSYNTSAV